MVYNVLLIGSIFCLLPLYTPNDYCAHACTYFPVIPSLPPLFYPSPLPPPLFLPLSPSPPSSPSSERYMISLSQQCLPKNPDKIGQCFAVFTVSINIQVHMYMYLYTKLFLGLFIDSIVRFLVAFHSSTPKSTQLTNDCPFVSLSPSLIPPSSLPSLCFFLIACVVSYMCFTS